ncbi:MAG: hypothetical protein HZT40_08345 [Candidatus Thiothrix singaporensis]|uniref:Uncharacterized protein n=1 Tax=Candidatus Thiothrix singaporensis TaxID=2799669 RepID=A0A7L6AR94_9GAMM|nr:MAG: hypothetical protein HZT40_08345 [Candidatus Thiothrix singaporensis]
MRPTRYRSKDAAQKDAGQPSRIKFDKGASTAVVTGKLADFDGEQTYLIEVGKGQTMTVEQLNKYSNGQISIYVTDPQGGDANDLDASCHGKATVTPTMAGDYKIQVMECKKPTHGRASLPSK